MCFICPYKNKIGKERCQAYPFKSRMICSVVHEAKEGGEKKNDDDKKWNCKSTPFHYLPISASLELLEWTLGDPTSHVSSSEERPLFRHWKSDNSSSGPDFEASTSIQKKNERKKNERKKERKKKRLLTSPKPSVSFIFLLPLCVYLANLFELRFVSDFIYT